MNVVFATNDRREAEQRLRAANSKLSDDTVARVGALVEAGAIRVGDNRMHLPGSIFPDRDLTDDEQAELVAISKQATAETLSSPVPELLAAAGGTP